MKKKRNEAKNNACFARTIKKNKRWRGKYFLDYIKYKKKKKSKLETQKVGSSGALILE